MILTHRLIVSSTLPQRKPLRPRFTRRAELRASGSTALTTAVEARAIPKYTLVGERERLLAMVDILAAAPREEVRALTRSAAFTRLDTRDAVLVSPEEHEERLLLLLEGRARGCEDRKSVA